MMMLTLDKDKDGYIDLKEFKEEINKYKKWNQINIFYLNYLLKIISYYI